MATLPQQKYYKMTWKMIFYPLQPINTVEVSVNSGPQPFCHPPNIFNDTSHQFNIFLEKTEINLN
jgi:hypothetical protein